MASKLKLREEIRQRYMEQVVEYFTAKGEEVLRTASNEIAMPCVDGEGNDEFIVLTFKVPTGSRDGEPYDGYGVADDFKMKTAEKAEKAKAAAEKKAKKIAKDEKARAAKAKAKAEHTAKAGE